MENRRATALAGVAATGRPARQPGACRAGGWALVERLVALARKRGRCGRSVGAGAGNDVAVAARRGAGGKGDGTCPVVTWDVS